MNIFNTIIVIPITNALLFVYYFLHLIGVPFALGFSIVVLTVIIRLVLYPLTSSQITASRKMMELSPHLNKLKEKYKNDAKTLQQETMRLYKEHGVNPAAGCLPLLIQLPIIWGLYSVLNKIINVSTNNLSQINNTAYVDFIKLSKAWDVNFFGVSLAQNPSHLISIVGPLVLLIPLLTGVFQFIQSKMMVVVPQQAGDKKSDLSKKDGKSSDDFSQAMQTQMVYLMPVMIGLFSYNFPVGLSLYWNTFTIFGIIQQYQISGLGGLKEWIDKVHGKV